MNGITVAWWLTLASLGALGLATWRWFSYEPRGFLRERHAGWGAAIVIALIASAVFGFTASIFTAGRASCYQQADGYGRPARYGMLAGCRVRTNDGVFVPLDNYRVTHEEPTSPGE